ncbi:unnamed protein product [Miscanthus lutarioriparius]|uniref:Uncharacterized protein n=1 Tax=Miscanthus lutarioriparius TaxID=422564 RepID=A0A811QAA9_9POAL|nr:unnamed protein product [Miscanthus lutarioriparius]
MPVVGLPMLLQSWEAMQDGHAAAVVQPTVVAQPSEAAPTTASRDTTPVSTSMEGSTTSASLEAGQPSMDSPSPNGSTQPLVQDSNAIVPNVPPPLPAHRDRFQEVPSTDEAGRAVPDAPPPPPSVVQGAPPAAKVKSAPPGSISAAVRAKRAATKLKRSSQMGSLVEGSGSTHGGKRRQNGKRLRTACAPKSDAGGQNMADALAEMTKRSTYFRQIEEDAEKHAAAILEVKDAIGLFQSKDMAKLVRLHQHVEQQLVSLTDETQVRGLPFQETGGAEDGGRALLQAGRRRLEAQMLEAHRWPRLAAARQSRELLQQGPFTAALASGHWRMPGGTNAAQAC